MALPVAARPDEPYGELNTTPLIDVMLVILVVLILSVPLSTHSLDYDLPGVAPPPNVDLHEDRNRLAITANDAVLWNGTPITDNQLVANLQQTLAFAVEPELQYEPESEASYDLAAKVLNIIKASGVTKFGFVGNEKYRVFGKG